MDSDSSQDGDERQSGCRRRDWENRQNSDVSDDENFSRGAKSIDSPPESPPRGGGNLDSPPASPAQGVESPHSVYSGSRSGGSSGEGTPDYPQSPDSPPPKSPASPERADSRSRLTERDDSNSPDRGNSRIGEREDSISPVPGSGHSGARIDSPSPGRGNSPGSYRDESESPDRHKVRARDRDVSLSPERDNRHSTERDDSQSPERRKRHSSGRDRSSSPAREYSRSTSKTRESIEKYGKRSYSQSPNGTYSSIRNSRFTSPENSDSPRRIYHEKDSHRSSVMNRNRSQSPDIKYSSSPTRQDNRDKKSKGNKSKSPDGHSTSYRNEDNSQDWPASPPTVDSISNKGTPNRNKIASPSSIGSSSPVAKKCKYDTRDNSPDSHAQSISSRDSSPTDERNFHTIRNHVRNKSSIERSNLSSPDRNLKKNRLHKDNSRSKHNREKHKSPNYKRVSPRRHSDSDGRSNISSDSSIGSPSPKSRSPEPKRGNKTDKVEIKSHGEDLSDVSDIESIGSDEEQKAKEVKKVGIY